MPHLGAYRLVNISILILRKYRLDNTYDEVIQRTLSGEDLISNEDLAIEYEDQYKDL